MADTITTATNVLWPKSRLGVRLIVYTGSCSNKWNCYYIPIIVFYTMGFCAALFLQVKGAADEADDDADAQQRRRRAYTFRSSKDGSPRWQRWFLPPRCLRRDACLWPLYGFWFILPVILWPVIAAVALIVLAGCLLFWGLQSIYEKRETLRPRSCCGIRLPKAKKRDADDFTARLTSLEQRRAASTVTEPLPTYMQTQTTYA